MEQIEEHDRRFKSNKAKKSLRVDLTPMVDLGFLLITFFILTTALSEPKVTGLIMPKESKLKTLLKESATLTLTLNRNDSIDYYEGNVPAKELIRHCSFNHLRSVIQQKQLDVSSALGDRKKMVIIISPGPESTYKNFIDALDEIEINDVRHYFVVDDR